jgi:hypothetical protein
MVDRQDLFREENVILRRDVGNHGIIGAWWTVMCERKHDLPRFSTFRKDEADYRIHDSIQQGLDIFITVIHDGAYAPDVRVWVTHTGGAADSFTAKQNSLTAKLEFQPKIEFNMPRETSRHREMKATKEAWPPIIAQLPDAEGAHECTDQFEMEIEAPWTESQHIDLKLNKTA